MTWEEEMGNRSDRKFKKQAGCGSKNALRRARRANDPGSKGSGRRNRREER